MMIYDVCVKSVRLFLEICENTLYKISFKTLGHASKSDWPSDKGNSLLLKVFVIRSLYFAGIMNSAIIMEENIGHGKQSN